MCDINGKAFFRGRRSVFGGFNKPQVFSYSHPINAHASIKKFLPTKLCFFGNREDAVKQLFQFVLVGFQCCWIIGGFVGSLNSQLPHLGKFGTDVPKEGTSSLEEGDRMLDIFRGLLQSGGL